MYKVFIENKGVLFFSNNNQLPNNRNLILCEPDFISFKEIRKRRRKVKKDILLAVRCENEKAAWKDFKSSLRLVEAAGGLVENKKGAYLLIFRNRRWDLPKGKLKKNEGRKKGAVREVEEECGVDGLVVKSRITKTFHVVNRNGSLILKKVFWYKMFTPYSGALTPQVTEGITKVEWSTKKKAVKRFQNSWGTIRDVVEAAKIIKTKQNRSKK